jgi:protein-tyrosine phosphatase
MVCLGNICRSPLAEGILQSKVDKNLVFVDSAGTASYHVGNIPDKRSIDVASKYGVDISSQKARKFIVEDFDIFDVIFVMDASNYQNVLSIARNYEDIQKVKMILNETHPGKEESVPDPYYLESAGFEEVYKMLDGACIGIAKNSML